MGAPEFLRLGDDAFDVSWPEHGIQIEVTNVHESHHDVFGLITVNCPSGMLHFAKLNLLAPKSRADTARFLTGRTNGGPWDVDWPGMLEQCCTLVVRAWQDGGPFVDLADVVQKERPPELLSGFLPQRQISIVYTRGGAGKSMLAQACCASIISGQELIAGIRPGVTGPVLYLDWEADEDEIQQRTLAMLRGMGVPALPKGQFIYRSMTRALADEGGRIGMEIVRQGVSFVVVDSLSAACGASAINDDVAQATMNAIRAWRGVSTLVIAHVNKADATASGQGPKSIFGSIQFENRARLTAELIRSQDVPEEQGMAWGIFPRKKNRGVRNKPFGMRLRFTGDPDWPERIDLQRWDIEGDPSLSGALSLGSRILRLLTSRGKLGTDEIAEELGVEEQAAKAALNRLARAKTPYVQRQETGGGRGKVTVWAATYQEPRLVDSA